METIFNNKKQGRSFLTALAMTIALSGCTSGQATNSIKEGPQILEEKICELEESVPTESVQSTVFEESVPTESVQNTDFEESIPTESAQNTDIEGYSNDDILILCLQSSIPSEEYDSLDPHDPNYDDSLASLLKNHKKYYVLVCNESNISEHVNDFSITSTNSYVRSQLCDIDLQIGDGLCEYVVNRYVDLFDEDVYYEEKTHTVNYSIDENISIPVADKYSTFCSVEKNILLKTNSYYIDSNEISSGISYNNGDINYEYSMSLYKVEDFSDYMELKDRYSTSELQKIKEKLNDELPYKRNNKTLTLK